MDKRVVKTKRDIKDSFLKLLENKNYNDITIQDILNESNIARSTFYMHFESKEDILSSITEDIFEHISSSNLEKENHHDFSNKKDFKHIFLHMLTHFYEDRNVLKAVFDNDSYGVFLKLLHHSIIELIETNENIFLTNNNVPESLTKKIVTIDIMNIIKRWIKEDDFSSTPEDICNYFYTLSKGFIK